MTVLNPGTRFTTALSIYNLIDQDPTLGNTYFHRYKEGLHPKQKEILIQVASYKSKRSWTVPARLFLASVVADLSERVYKR